MKDLHAFAKEPVSFVLLLTEELCVLLHAFAKEPVFFCFVTNGGIMCAFGRNFLHFHCLHVSAKFFTVRACLIPGFVTAACCLLSFCSDILKIFSA